MKVMIISTVGLIYDGITSVISEYLKSMDKNGLEIYIVATIKSEDDLVAQLTECGCNIVHLSSRRKKTLKYFVELISFIKKNNIQVVHAHGNSATLAIEMLAAYLGGCKKRIAHSHNTRCDSVKADKLLRYLFNSMVQVRLACGEDAGKWLFRDRSFIVLKNGRNIDKFKYNQLSRLQFQEKYEIKEEFVIGHVGGFVLQKNHAFLLEIYREIVNLYPKINIKFFMIGDGELRQEIEEKAAIYGLKDRIVFTGNINNVNELLQIMDVMVLPSLFEGLPLVVIEWQISGLPCLISDTITTECVITDTVEFCSLNESPAVWANKLIEMASKKKNREDCSEIACIKVKEAGFDIIDNAQKLKDIYC